MSLRARILSRAAPPSPMAQVIPKARGTGSAFGLRRAPVPAAPEQEPEVPVSPLRRSADTVSAPRPVQRDAKAQDAEDPIVTRAPTSPAQLKPEDDEISRTTTEEPATDIPRTAAPALQQTPPPPTGDFTLAQAGRNSQIARPSRDAPAVQRQTQETPQEDRSLHPKRAEPAPEPDAILAQRQIHTPDAMAGNPASPETQGQTTPPITLPRPNASFALPEEGSRVDDFPSETQQQDHTFEPRPAPQADLEMGHSPMHPDWLATVEAPAPTPVAPDRPQVTIDQIDVVVMGGAQNTASNLKPPSSASALLSRRWLRR